MFLHFGHLQQPTIKVGDTYSSGNAFAKVGDSGAPGASHLHFDTLMIHPQEHPHGAWVGYTTGMDSIQVQQLYENPNHWLEGKVYPVEGGKVTGYDFLQRNAHGQFHPGIDINYGSRYDDFGRPVYAPVDMRIIYVGYSVDAKGYGWGHHIWAETLNEITREDMERLSKLEKYVYDYHEKNLSFLNQLTGDLVREVEKMDGNIVIRARVKKLRRRIEQYIGEELPALKNNAKKD